MDAASQEKFRQRILAAAEAYDARLESDLNRYRSQRAWKVMLAVRKAYALAVRGGFRGWFRLLGWAFGGLVGRPLDLESEDLRFPSVAEYLPEELFSPAAERRSHSPVADQRRHDVLVFPVIDYDFRFQRPQQIAAAFARQGHRVFWVSPSRVVAGPEARPYQAVPIRENLWELQLRMQPMDLYRGVLTRSALDAVTQALAAVRRDFGSAPTCSMVQFPYWRQCALALRERFGDMVLCDCMDDWRHWTNPPIGPFALAEEEKLVRECDLLLVTSRELEARYLGEGLSPLLVKNAADFARFASGSDRGLLADLPRPVIGYYGAIADWFDVSLVYEAARLRPGCSFVLIGHAYRSDIGRLKSLPNVRLLGEMDYRDLPSYLREFDVCMIPFVLDGLTRAVDPVKVYEYLSQGKPVVATRLPELAGLGRSVYIAGGADEFVAQTDAALAESDPALRQERVRFAAANTWTDRVHTIADGIRSKLPLVSILIVTYNCREFLRPCLDSILRNGEYPNYEVIVVDNHSSDGTEEILSQYVPADPRIRIHVFPENLGFAGANNQAARLSRGDYLLLLNPDTIVTPGWIHRLMRVFETHPTAGIAAPVTNFSGNETKIDVDYSDLATLDRFARSNAGSHSGECFEVSVAPLLCALVRCELWLSLGGLDESFRVGTFEDDDFSLRVRRAGLKVLVAKDCFIHHFGNGSFGKLPAAESNRVFEENRARFEEKWKAPWEPHRLRPGVRSLQQERRFLPHKFRSGSRQ
jgi:GT2 family glycosyltransferase/glycosyltransferase involved in cell wall biosynthesis